MTRSSALTATVLIVSETASRDASTDKCIPALEDVFHSQRDQWEVTETAIVTDSILDIQHFLLNQTDTPDAPNLIVLSGGTGFAVKDITPEVFLDLQSIYDSC
jgi:gephyrin